MDCIACIVIATRCWMAGDREWHPINKAVDEGFNSMLKAWIQVCPLHIGWATDTRTEGN